MNDLLTSTTADGSILDVGTYTRIVEGFEENDYSGIAHFTSQQSATIYLFRNRGAQIFSVAGLGARSRSAQPFDSV